MPRRHKMENVLVCTSGDIQLCDFGCATLFGNKSLVQKHPDTWAPEIVHERLKTTNAIYVRPQHDWWEVGVLAHELLVGEAPFTGADNGLSIMAQILLGYNSDKLPEDISHLKSIIKIMFEPNDEHNIPRGMVVTSCRERANNHRCILQSNDHCAQRGGAVSRNMWLGQFEPID